MSSVIHDLSAAAHAAFAVLQGATEIHYRQGELWTWKAQDDEQEHPVVHRLRAAAMASVLSDPPEPGPTGISDVETMLREERRVNENFRTFLVALEKICHDADMPRETQGQEILTWLRKKLIG